MLPVQKHSKSRKRKRRSHQALKPIHYVRCPQCGNAKLPHAACDNCGADVPLRGLTHVEHTGVLEGDDADTVTCPECGVETPALAV